ncbi:DUF262 domain-containing protein [Mesorhizobium sp. M1328]|uniref:GmrSD restriction endonuclease domain-containing protein n=1 Tax=Mesorhizobium sp. M1328 TaxID=2957082 RepID=UPI00333B357B
MKISTILDHIDSGHMALPEFQRGYVWNTEQVRGLFTSPYRKHPVGGLLVWATEAQTANHRGDGKLASGIVKLLLDGQQRITSLYGVARGKPPAFFDGNARAFTGLHFHLATETFEFYQPLKMSGDPLWIDVSDLMKSGNAGIGKVIQSLGPTPPSDYFGRLLNLLGVLDKELHIDEVTGADKTLDVVVDIFNKVNSGGTKLSKGDLALAKICAEWPEARIEMKGKLKAWNGAGYDFNLDWLLRSINTVLTGEAKFLYLHSQSAIDIQDGLKRATRRIDTCLNLIAGRLGLDHARVFFGRFAVPVIVRYLDQKGAALNEIERDKLLFWFAQAGMWGRYSGSTESFLDKDLEALEGPDGGLDKLLEQLRLWHGGMRVEAGHFTGWSLGARFYPILYMLTRMGAAKDWGTGIALKSDLLGKMNALEVHHIFPKAQLYGRKVPRSQVNAIANFCFLTKDTNLNIRDTLPEVYFPKVEEKHPGALASQWIPMDESLWKIERYADFLDARKDLLAAEANRRFAELLHGDDRWIGETARVVTAPVAEVAGDVSSVEEEAELQALNAWVASQGFGEGVIAFDHSNAETGDQIAMFDLAWPNGLQEELSEPVAVLLNESDDIIALASAAGFRCFTSVAVFKDYVNKEMLGELAA